MGSLRNSVIRLLLLYCLVLSCAFLIVYSRWPLDEKAIPTRSSAPITCPPCVQTTQAELTQAYDSDDQISIVVPFRDRLEELMQFVPHMHTYLTKKRIRYQIWVINQDDRNRFNRAALINTGFLLARRFGCTYMAMHDVDLLPLNFDLDYSYPHEGPYHVAAPWLHPLYHYKTFVGGILIMSNGQFEKVDGLSTRYWGWGREDDELFRRLKDASLEIKRGTDVKTGPRDTFRHLHDSKRRKRDYARIGEQKKVQWQRDTQTGLSSMPGFYRVKSIVNLTIDGYLAKMVNVEFLCDETKTPWCVHSG